MLRARWINNPRVDKIEDGLLFEVFSLEQMFEKSDFETLHSVQCSILKLNDYLPNEKEANVALEMAHPLFNLRWKDEKTTPEFGVLFSGFENNIQAKEIKPRVHRIGSPENGDGRFVYEFITIENNLPIRAGLTVHMSNGSWSSHPSHAFEQQMLMRPIGDHFDELFALMTFPRGGWGACFNVGWHNAETTNPEFTRGVSLFNDRSFLRMPLGYHPVVAQPGAKLAYFWCYQSNSTAFVEKFTHE